MKKRKYNYKSIESKLAAQARGRKLQASVSLEVRRERYQHMQQGLEIYREATKIAKTDKEYKAYWEEIQKLRKQAKKLGKTLNLSNVTGAPSQIRGKDIMKEARIALGLGASIDAENVLEVMMKDGTVYYDESRNQYIYDGKSYAKEDLLLMFSAPQKFFAAGSPFWNKISEYYHTAGELYVSEIFGS